jgi:hypothetical protein
LSSADLWCDHCSRLIGADAIIVDDEGREHCPRCAEFLGEDAPAGDAEETEYEEDEEDGPPKPPWHFKVLLIATVIYLVYSLIWFIFWISHHA